MATDAGAEPEEVERRYLLLFMKTYPNHPLVYGKEEEEEQALRAEVQRTNKNPLTIWRTRHGLSRVELAALAGINVNVIEKLENGYFKFISQKLLLTLHDVGIPYEVAASYLIWRNLIAEEAKCKVANSDVER